MMYVTSPVKSTAPPRINYSSNFSIHNDTYRSYDFDNYEHPELYFRTSVEYYYPHELERRQTRFDFVNQNNRSINQNFQRISEFEEMKKLEKEKYNAKTLYKTELCKKWIQFGNKNHYCIRVLAVTPPQKK